MLRWFLPKLFSSNVAGESQHQPAVLQGAVGRVKTEFKVEEQHCFHQEFERQLESWCFGLSVLNEEPLPEVVFKVCKEFSATLKEALGKGYAFDILRVAGRISKAAQNVVDTKQLVFSLMSYLPAPQALTPEAQVVFAVVIAQVEQTFGGAVERAKERFQIGAKPEGASICAPASQAPGA